MVGTVTVSVETERNSKGTSSRAHQKGTKSSLIWEVDPLICPKCAGEMKIISFIYKRTVIKKILAHLGVYQERQKQRATPVVPPDYTGQIEILPYDDGWPEYEEAVFDF